MKTKRNRRRITVAGIGILLSFAFIPFFCPMPAEADLFSQINLVTDDQLINPAMLTDPHLKNAWGISFSATSPFWISDNGSGLVTLYSVNPATNVATITPLVVSIPGGGSVTGQVFNSNSGSGAFNGDLFLFVSEDGTISGWRGALGTTAETLVALSAGNVYKGAALYTSSGNTYLYAANFRTGTINVIKGTAGAPDLPGNFTDPNLPAGYAPFDIRLLNGRLYVTYALQDASKHDDVAGPGHGFVDVFDTNGNFLGRVASQGTLNSPWGLAIAPATFGQFAGELLVGNFGDGRISAFDLSNNNAFEGQLLDLTGNPLTIDGLWGLTTGNSGNGGSMDKLYFSAGPNNEANGLFGVIQPAPEPTTILLLGSSLIGLALYRRRKVLKG
jgi:uncharacterized protein (TIGR03118 family)